MRVLPLSTVESMHQALGGDPKVAEMNLSFIKYKYGARSLGSLPEHVAAPLVKRPADFIQAAKDYCEPEFF
jgi:hypothetical protein